jgi:hypothetical protein
MTRHSCLLGGSACLADPLRLEDLRTLERHMRALPRPAERELPSRDSLPHDAYVVSPGVELHRLVGRLATLPLGKPRGGGNKPHLPPTHVHALHGCVVVHDHDADLAVPDLVAVPMQSEEQQRGRAFEAELDRWALAGRIRTYLTALREGIESRRLRLVADQRDLKHFERWFAWARWYADCVDPLADAGPSPLEPKPEPPPDTPVAELDLTRRAGRAIETLGITTSDQLHRVKKEQVEGAGEWRSRDVWDEVCCVREGLGYDVAERQSWL